MESRADFQSISPYLPLIHRSSAASWPPAVVEALETLSKGPNHSHVNTGEHLATAINDLRNSLKLPSLPASASHGFSLFFDDLISTDESDNWFAEVVPKLADLTLKLPQLLVAHYQNAFVFYGKHTGLRVLEPQEPGIVFLSQELIAALLATALFCLFPINNRTDEDLPPTINFDELFGYIYETEQAQENKIKCIVHYIKRVCSSMPKGKVSFERKVVDDEDLTNDYWSESCDKLSRFEVFGSGLIEDQPHEALEVEFANQYIGGATLGGGFVQEEIRFMINPELIVGMLFIPAMDQNEAIEIVGPERFSNYEGYASSFRFRGDYVDKRSADLWSRRKTRVIAMDALAFRHGMRQYNVGCLVRETNKAFCGFLDTRRGTLGRGCEEIGEGVATGNWGCGVFGGDAEVKVVIQWMAASQAMRPFVLYYTFGLRELRKLEEVVEWIVSRGWCVGDVWSMLVEYSGERLKGETRFGLFRWLIPTLYDDEDEDDDDEDEEDDGEDVDDDDDMDDLEGSSSSSSSSSDDDCQDEEEEEEEEEEDEDGEEDDDYSTTSD